MKAGKHNVRELFQQDIRYGIPTFQRPYVWRQSTQWEPLWNDVRNIAEGYAEELEAASNNPSIAEQTIGTHFLGAIVLQQIPTSPTEIKRHDVIDGQQRMITLQILLDAAQEVVELAGSARNARQLQKLVLNDEDFAEGDDRFKLWPASGDQDAFRAAMTNGQAVDKFENSLIVQAHEFFSLQIQEWLHEEDEESRERRIDALVTTLIGLLELVVIDLKSEDDAYVIFETLNARGTPLLASDLVKNFVLQTANLNGINKETQLSRERKIRCLRIIESYLVRRMMCRMTTKDYNRLFLELISQVKGNIGIADEVIFNFLHDQTSESREWPSDERLQNALLDLPLYRLLTRGRLRMVLEALEEALRTDKAEERHVKRGKLTIEHVLPQTWQTHWPIELIDDPEEYHRRVGQRERIKHTLGNLTLVSWKLNPSLSNSPWQDKQQDLHDHTVLYLNKRLLSTWGNVSFAEPEIRERGTAC